MVQTMGMLDNLKDAVRLAQTVGNADLYQKLNGVQTDFLELSEKARELQEENDQLREQLRQKDRMDEFLAKRTHRNNAYWIDDEGPYCTCCWDAKGQIVRMIAHAHAGGAECPACNTKITYDRKAAERYSQRVYDGLKGQARGQRLDW
jgi:hypothetical protein